MQAPIGSGAGIELCSAVNRAGGLGGISLTWKSPTEGRSVVRTLRTICSGHFYANFVLHFDPICLAPALDEGLPMATFSWGNPESHMRDLKLNGTEVGIQVTSLESAQRMLELHPDFLIVQGIEAGGHVQSHDHLFDVLPAILEVAGQVPVFAAGGLATGLDLFRVLKLGAFGAVFGTRFVASVESEAHSAYKDLLLHSHAADTVLTTCFDGGWAKAPHRVLRNSTYRAWESDGCPMVGERPGESEVVSISGSGEPILRYDDAMPRPEITGDWEAMCLYAGTSVEQIRSIKSAEQITSDIWEEAQTLIQDDV